MPKGGKRSEKKNRDITSDVKLSDFADCSARTGRLRKSAGSSLDQEVEDGNSEDLWFNKDLDDFEFPAATSERRRKQVKCKVSPEDLKKRPGIQYPLDIWYLIGGYIKPEDVGKFAAICKGSHCVSRTYSFWTQMYKRHYQSSPCLPSRLQPECLEASLCVKVFVVRALYCMYPRFMSHWTSAAVSTPDVYSLTNLCCTSTWYSQRDGKWFFYFKLQAPTEEPAVNYRLAIRNMWTKQGGEEEYERTCDSYVNLNPDEGCKILLVSCSNFVLIPHHIMGSFLVDVRVSLAHDLRRQGLRLIFKSDYRKTKSNGSKPNENIFYGHAIELNPVESISVLDWWHPQFPSDHLKF